HNLAFGSPLRRGVYRLSDRPLRSMLMRRSRSAASAAREEGMFVGAGPSPSLSWSSGLFDGAVDEVAEVAPACDRTGRIGLPVQRGSNGITRQPVLVVACGSVLVGIERWRCGVDVVGSPSAGGGDVELSVVGAVVDDHVGFVHGG